MRKVEAAEADWLRASESYEAATTEAEAQAEE